MEQGHVRGYRVFGSALVASDREKPSTIIQAVLTLVKRSSGHPGIVRGRSASRPELE